MSVVRRRGSESFDDAFDGLAVLARRVAFRILGNRADADDVAQEALARAFLRWHRVEDHAEPWVARVATNLAISQWRRRRPPPKAEEGSVTPIDRLVTERAEIVELLGRLPRRQREVVVLRFLADRSEQETADALGCSAGTVKQHAHRALAALRRAATDPADQPDDPLPGVTDARPSG